MNAFLYAKIGFGQISENGQQKTQEFNLIFDSVYNYAQHPLNFVLYHCPEKNAGNDGKPACKRHAMKLYKPQSAPSDGDAQGEVTTLDGVKLKMKIAEDRMEYNGIVVENAKFMLLDGANFKLFDPMLDSGAAGSPQIDGVFSLALGNGEFRSGMEQLLDKKAEKIATVYMQPFQDLDFFSKTTARVSVGQLNQQNCAFAEKPEWLGIVKSTPKNWKIDMEVKISGDNNEELLQLSKQQVLISTSGTFIFAPKSVTDLLTPHLTLVNDNSLFKLGRSAGKAGLAVKDVLIECPTEEQMKKLPTIKFALGKQTFTLTPKEYIFKLKVPLNPVKGTQKVGLFNWCHPMIRERPETGMYAKFMLPENNKDQWLFGQLFFNKACVAFKYGETPQLALAPTIANPTN